MLNKLCLFFSYKFFQMPQYIWIFVPGAIALFEQFHHCHQDFLFYQSYNLIDNIIVATKFANKNIAQQICDECSRNFQIDLVVIPIIITYEILEEI